MIHTMLALERIYGRGELERPLVILLIDEPNCFGWLRWETIQARIQDAIPSAASFVTWKHSVPSAVEQPGVPDMLKNRGGTG